MVPKFDHLIQRYEMLCGMERDHGVRYVAYSSGFGSPTMTGSIHTNYIYRIKKKRALLLSQGGFTKGERTSSLLYI
jgi:hypothetical protein